MTSSEPLTLNAVARNPSDFSFVIEPQSGEPLVLRPLLPGDVEVLAQFLAGLSAATRRLSTFPSFDHAMAKALCAAINRYDKLRFVLASPTGDIGGLFEFSFDLTADDVSRYQAYGRSLDPAATCRFGPTLADAYQNRRIGSLVYPFMAEIARRFGQKRMILLGGVLKDNRRAIRYYEKHGFEQAGEFQREGELCVDMIRAL